MDEREVVITRFVVESIKFLMQMDLAANIG